MTAIQLSLVLLTLAVLTEAAARYTVSLVDKQTVVAKTVSVTDPNTSLASLRKMFADDDKPALYIPPFCNNQDGKEMEPHEPVSGMDQRAGYLYSFVRHADKMYVVTFCPGTTYKQLRPHVARRLNLANKDLGIKSDDIAFDGIIDESVAVVEQYQDGPGKKVYTNQRFLTVVKREKKRSKPPKLEQLSGTSVEIEIPNLGKCTIENVNMDGTVGQLRAAILAKYGADANYHKSLAFCNHADGKEAKDDAKLSTVFKNNSRSYSTDTFSVVDWSTGSKKEHKVTYCSRSTFKDVFARALPSWKTTVDNGDMVSVWKVSKKNHDSKDDGALTKTAQYPLTTLITAAFPPPGPLLPKDDSLIYTVLEGSSLMTVAGKRLCLTNGDSATVGDIREALAKEIGHVKAWQLAFCSNDAERNQNDRFMTNVPYGDFNLLETQNVLVLPSDNPKDHRTFTFQLCKRTTYDQLKRRVHGIMKLSPDDKVHISYLDAAAAGNYVNVNPGDIVYDSTNPNANTKRNLLACINEEHPKPYVVKQPWIQSYFSSVNSFSAIMEGDVAQVVQNIDPLSKVGELRKRLIKDHAGNIEEDRLKRFPFCAANGEEMEDEKSFSDYGITGGTPVTFGTKKVWFVDWSNAGKPGFSSEEKSIDVCEKSTYKQIVSRAVADRDRILHSQKDFNIIVEDQKPADAKKASRKSFIVSPSAKLHSLLTIHETNASTSVNKDKSKIYLMPKKMTVVGVADQLIAVSDPDQVRVGVIRDHFLKKNKDSSDPFKMAYCADMQWMFWEAKEMDENRSFSYYGFRPDTWTKLAKPDTVTVKYTHNKREGEVKMEYCLRSTQDDIKYRLAMYLKDPTSRVVISASAVDYPAFLIWCATGDTNFMPSQLIAEVVTISKEFKDGTMKPTDAQKKMATIRSDSKAAVDAGMPVPSKSVAEQLIEALPKPPADKEDPMVIKFKAIKPVAEPAKQ